MTLNEVVTLISALVPILVPAAIALLGLLVKHSPFLRNPELQKLAYTAVSAAEQQGKGGWTGDQKYAAAAEALTLLASKAGYKVDPNEARNLIESSVLAVQSFSHAVVKSDAGATVDATPAVSVGDSELPTPQPSLETSAAV